MIENRALVYIGDFGRLSSTGRASKDVPVQLAKPPLGAGKHYNFL